MSTVATFTQAVDRRSRLSQQAFIAEYLRPHRPVIITDVIDEQSPLASWTPDFFRQRYGSRRVTIDGAEYGFADLVDRIERSTSVDPAPYFRNVLVEQWDRTLLRDVLPLPRQTNPNWLDSRFFPERPSLTSVELYIGGAGAAFPVLHFDNLHTHAFLVQVYGAKEYIFYSPDQSDFLYPRQGTEANKSAVDDVDHPGLDRFPLFAQAMPTRCTLRAGELLFVPSGWWHTARILNTSITISANTVNITNWQPFLRDYIAAAKRRRSRRYGWALTAYLEIFGVVSCLVSLW